MKKFYKYLFDLYCVCDVRLMLHRSKMEFCLDPVSHVLYVIYRALYIFLVKLIPSSYFKGLL